MAMPKGQPPVVSSCIKRDIKFLRKCLRVWAGVLRLVNEVMKVGGCEKKTWMVTGK